MYDVLTLADEFFQRRDFRKAADLYWDAFNQYSTLWLYRYRNLSTYGMIVAESSFQHTQSDLDNLRQVLDDENEASVYRVHAGLTLGVLH
jgi:hypothetical protein